MINKKAIAGFQIVLLISMSFAIAFILGESFGTRVSGIAPAGFAMFRIREVI